MKRAVPYALKKVRGTWRRGDEAGRAICAQKGERDTGLGSWEVWGHGRSGVMGGLGSWEVWGCGRSEVVGGLGLWEVWGCGRSGVVGGLGLWEVWGCGRSGFVVGLGVMGGLGHGRCADLWSGLMGGSGSWEVLGHRKFGVSGQGPPRGFRSCTPGSSAVLSRTW